MTNSRNYNNKSNNIYFVLGYVVVGWILYSPMTSWLISNPDGIYLGIIYREGDGSSAFGRIGVGMVIKLMYKVVSPNLMMLICLFMLGAIVCMIAEGFGTDYLWEKMIIGLLVLISPSMSSQLTYYYCMVQYILAFVFSVLAWFLVIKVKRPWAVIVSAGLIMAQLSLYQAFLSVLVVLSFFYIIYMLLKNEDLNSAYVTMFCFFFSAVLGVGLYMMMLRTLKVELDPVRGFDSMGKMNLLQRLSLVKTSYLYFIDYLFGDAYINNTWMHRKHMNMLVVAALILIVLYVIIANELYKQKTRLFIISVCIAALPMGFELMVIAAPKVDMHGTTGIIMIPSMSLLYISIVWLWKLAFNTLKNNECLFKTDNILRKYGCVMVLVPILYNFLLFTSVFENVMWLNYQSMYALCQKISTRIDEVGGYEPNVRIAFVGYPQDGNYPPNHEELRSIVRGTIAEKYQIWENGGYLSSCVFQSFYRTYFGIDYEIITNDDYNRLIDSELIMDMGVFPDTSSVVRNGNMIVVKVSEVE